MTKKLIACGLSAGVFIWGCGDSTAGSGGAGGSGTVIPTGGAPTVGEVRSFGFIAVGCGWDDPLDAEKKTAYFDEVADFTNVAHVCPFAADQDIGPDLETLAASGSRAVIDLTAVLFESTTSEEGLLQNALRPDAAALWETFVSTNSAVLDTTHVAAFYPVDEPFWTGVPFDDLDAVTSTIKGTFPEVPVLVVEAYPALADLQVPTTVDWVGFDRYYIRDPSEDPDFLADWETLKAARSRSDQKLVLILDTHHTTGHEAAGIAPEDMDDVARSAVALAASEPDTVAVLGYLWPGGVEGEQQLGARELPEEVRAFYESYGKAVMAAP